MAWDGEVCVIGTDSNGKCPPGFTQAGRKCQKQATKLPECPPGLTLAGSREACVSVFPNPSARMDSPSIAPNASPTPVFPNVSKWAALSTARSVSLPTFPPALTIQYSMALAASPLSTPSLALGSFPMVRANVSQPLSLSASQALLWFAFSCIVGIPTCLKGTIFDGKQCISPKDLECPPDHKWSNERCISLVSIDCEPGYTLLNGEFISENKPECPTGTTFDGEVCLGSIPECNEGTVFDGEDYAYPEEPSCPSGMRFNGKRCVAEDQPGCQAGTVFDKKCKKCVAVDPPGFPEGQIFNGNRCTFASEECMSFEYCPAVRECSEGSVFDKHTGRIIKWAERFLENTQQTQDKID
ncbi:hypothetical protein BELL_0636g00050 [Botrytis elliptica]|uniref:Uncharacterized protein n=1 Tax=Botrytis elliptica TaxID=278938 RepID=A0A4Z1JI75_9HELO|nr:hypothetical protein BELL_0636g00050 [Botrytis elliptica]